MQFELWSAFVLASIALLAMPGPTVTVVVSHAMARGLRTIWATAPGVVLGDLTAMLISLAGAGALLAASANLFSALKWLGAAYLIYLGLAIWWSESDSRLVTAERPRKSGMGMLLQAYIVSSLNPKALVFFIAFFPQFVDPNAEAVDQFVLLGSTYLVLTTVNTVFWGLIASRLSSRFRAAAAAQRWTKRIAGGCLISSGCIAAVSSSSRA